MARKGRSRSSEINTKRQRKNREKEDGVTGVEEFGMDEVDAFADARDKMLLNKAGMGEDGYRSNGSEDDEEEGVEGVMDIDSDVEIERYKKKFQGPIDESDEEYFRAEDDDGDEEREGEDGIGGWGGDYYGADDAEDEEDEKLLEEEAMRLQKKHMEELHMDDFMMDEVEDWKSDKNADKEKGKVEKEEDEDEKFEKMVQTGDKESRMEMINKKYPEYLPLISEMKELKELYETLKDTRTESRVNEVQFKALSLYLGSIISYLSVFVSNLQKGERFDMKEEDVMVSILSTREIWRQAKCLVDGVVGNREEEEEGDEEDDNYESIEQQVEQQSDEEEEEEKSQELGSESDQSEEESTKPADFGKLRSIKKLTGKKLEDMDEIDAEEKKGRRKTLRFYTSKIDKRDIGRTAVDGDLDAAYEDKEPQRKSFSNKGKDRRNGRGFRKGGRR